MLLVIILTVVCGGTDGLSGVNKSTHCQHITASPSPAAQHQVREDVMMSDVS